MADVRRKASKRARMTSPEKVKENVAKVKRMAGLRARMTSLEKKEANAADAKSSIIRVFLLQRPGCGSMSQKSRNLEYSFFSFLVYSIYSI